MTRDRPVPDPPRPRKAAQAEVCRDEERLDGSRRANTTIEDKSREKRS